MAEDELISVVVDIKTLQPACVLLQTALGGSSSICHMVDSKHWVLYPNNNLRRVSGTAEQWRKWANELNDIKKHGDKLR